MDFLHLRRLLLFSTIIILLLPDAYGQEIRKQAVQARWELMVHRQAAGFVVDNHRHVQKHYPISEALPLSTSEEANQPSSQPSKDKPRKKFGDQLDWWQKIGRWR